MEPQIGKLYKRYYQASDYAAYAAEKDIVIVTGIENLGGEYIILFNYLDDPEQLCEWNYAAFQDGMVEV